MSSKWSLWKYGWAMLTKFESFTLLISMKINHTETLRPPPCHRIKGLAQKPTLFMLYFLITGLVFGNCNNDDFSLFKWDKKIRDMSSVTLLHRDSVALASVHFVPPIPLPISLGVSKSSSQYGQGSWDSAFSKFFLWHSEYIKILPLASLSLILNLGWWECLPCDVRVKMGSLCSCHPAPGSVTQWAFRKWGCPYCIF